MDGWGICKRVATHPPRRQSKLIATTDLTDVIQISSGSSHTCALLKGGTVKCWGPPGYGRLGNGSTSGDPNSFCRGCDEFD